jgi:cyclophilin family peptidyl-prolyl cis-trans isomerase
MQARPPTAASSSSPTRRHPWLDGRHAVFGYVTEGQDVVNAIVQGDKMESVTIDESVRPPKMGCYEGARR